MPYVEKIRYHQCINYIRMSPAVVIRITKSPYRDILSTLLPDVLVADVADVDEVAVVLVGLVEVVDVRRAKPIVPFTWLKSI